jgi:hypothetical protein
MTPSPFIAGALRALCFVCFFVWATQAAAHPVVQYAGGGADTRFHDVRELSNGTVLVLGRSAHLDWIDESVPRTLLPISGVNSPGGSHVSFMLQISGDAAEILHVLHLPPGAVTNLRWMRTTEVPGDPTGLLYLSGQVPGGYFIGRLDGNFVDAPPTAFEWVFPVQAANGHEVYQPWDVGSDGRVVYGYGGEWSAQIGFLNPQGERTSLPALRASHWVDGGWQRGVGNNFDDVAFSAIRLPTDNQSWDDTELFAITPDGNGGIRQGTWPIDIMITHSFETGEPVRVIGSRAYGYNGYRPEGRHWIGAVAVDRRNNHFYYGFNIKSIIGTPSREWPDFEPAVIGYDDQGNMKWWNRLYREAADTTGDGLIDTTWVSEPDQYIDGLDVDYSVPLSEGGNVVVVGRCHGNNVSNFWAGNNIALRPGANGFQNRFTGNEGNIHISYIARLTADDGNLLAATYLAGFFRMIIGNRGNWPTQAYPEPIHDGWPNHNAGWPDLTTTRVVENSPRVGPDGRVYMVGWGPRMVTTSNAFQKLPRRLGHNNPILNEGTSPWNRWVRAYEPMLDRLAYSSTLTGQWTYPDGIDGNAVGADNVQLRGVWPTSHGLFVVGHHSNGNATSAGGNDMPTANVQPWGHTSYNGITGVFALMPFGEERPRAVFDRTLAGDTLSVDAQDSISTSAITAFEWNFGDGTTAIGASSTHTYTEPGTFLVSLRVTNEDGFSATAHRLVEVTDAAAVPPLVPPVRVTRPMDGLQSLGFSTQAGVHYQVQVASSLDPDAWSNWGDVMVGDGEDMSVEVDAPSTGDALFYRILITRP